MKDFLAKLKTMNYKQFALEHGEKIGLGVVGVVALACLGMTSWSSDFTVTPEDMEKQASKVDTELKAKAWPDAEKSTFLPLKTADEETQVALKPVELGRFEWEVEMSPKLYPRQRPAGEIDWLPVSELYARYGTMPMGVWPPAVPETPVEEEKTKKPAKKGKKAGHDADALMAGEGVGGFGMGMNDMGGPSAEKARGVRFNVVVGVVNVLEQQKRLAKAMNLDVTSQALQYLEYLDFKVQRQRAVPGPEPWTGPWKDLSTESSIDVIAESSDQDLEIVPVKYTAQVFTSPLPHRLDVDWWDPDLAGHPKVPTLTEDDQELQDALNRAAAEVTSDEGEDKTKRRGFAKNQRDANGLRDRAERVDGGKAFSEKLKSMGVPAGGGPGRGGHNAGGGGGRGMPMPGMGAMPGAGGGHAGGGGRGMPGAMGMPGMRGGGMPGMGAMGGMYGQSGMEVGANLWLFRYFDFDVEPGECYRYRVQLEVLNPNFGESFVDAPSVAEGETRTTPWSAPSTPAVVEKDVNYALAKVSTRGARPDGAELKVVQFDTNNGTLLSDQFKVLYGAYVGKVMKSLHLDIPGKRFEEEDVTFSSKDILLDSDGAPNLSSAVMADLKLDSKQFNNLKRGGDLDLAVTVNRFGEIVELDAGSKIDLEPELKKVEDERDDYKAIKNAEKIEKKARDKEAEEAAKDKKSKKGSKGGRRRKKKDGANPMMMPGGMPMPGMSGMPGTRGASSRGRGARND